MRPFISSRSRSTMPMTFPSLRAAILFTTLMTLLFECAGSIFTSLGLVNLEYNLMSVLPSAMRTVPLNRDLFIDIWLQMSSAVR